MVALECQRVTPATDGGAVATFTAFTMERPLVAAALGNAVWVILGNSGTIPPACVATPSNYASLTAVGLYSDERTVTLPSMDATLRVAGRKCHVSYGETATQFDVATPVYAAEALTYYNTHACDVVEKEQEDVTVTAAEQAPQPRAAKGALPHVLGMLRAAAEERAQRKRHAQEAYTEQAARALFDVLHSPQLPDSPAAAVADLFAEMEA
jgi:hypothetical protein